MTSKKKSKGKSPKKEGLRSPSPIVVEDIIDGFAFASFRSIDDLLDFVGDTSKLNHSQRHNTTATGLLQKTCSRTPGRKTELEASVDSAPKATQLSQLPGTPGRNDTSSTRKGNKPGDKARIKTKTVKGQAPKSPIVYNNVHHSGSPDKGRGKNEKKTPKCKSKGQCKSNKSKKRKDTNKRSLASLMYDSADNCSDRCKANKTNNVQKTKKLNHFKDTYLEKQNDESLDNQESQMDAVSDHSDDTVIMGPQSLEGSPRSFHSDESPVAETVDPKKSPHLSPKSVESKVLQTGNDPVDVKLENTPIRKMETMLNCTVMHNNVNNRSYEKLLGVGGSNVETSAQNQQQVHITLESSKSTVLGVPNHQKNDLQSVARFNNSLDKLECSLLEKAMSPSERIIEWRNKHALDNSMPLLYNKRESDQLSKQHHSNVPASPKQEFVHHGNISSLHKNQPIKSDIRFNNLDTNKPQMKIENTGLLENKSLEIGERPLLHKAAEASANKHKVPPTSSSKPIERIAFGPPPPLKPAHQDTRVIPDHHQRQQSLATVTSQGYTDRNYRQSTTSNSVVTPSHLVKTEPRLTPNSRSTFLTPSSRSNLSSAHTPRSTHSTRTPTTHAHVVRDQPRPIPGLSGTSRDFKAASPYNNLLHNRSGSASNIPSSPLAAAYPVLPPRPPSTALLPPHISPSIPQPSYQPDSARLFPSYSSFPAAQLLAPAPPRASPVLPPIPAPPRASPAPLTGASHGGLLAPPGVSSMFAVPPLSVAMPVPSAPGVPNFAADPLLHNPELLSRAQHDFSSRLMNDRHVSPLLRTEMHQHQHQHLHQHNYFPGGQGSSPLLPPPPPGLLATSSTAASLRHAPPVAVRSGIAAPLVRPPPQSHYINNLEKQRASRLQYDKLSKVEPPYPYRNAVPGLPGYPGLGPVPPIPGLPSAPASQLGSGLHGAFQPKSVPGAGSSGLHPAQLLLGMHDKSAGSTSAASSNSTQPGIKKSGKWCATHVRVAWMIHMNQQKQKTVGNAGGGEHKLMEHMPGSSLPRLDLTPNASPMHASNSQLRNPFESASDLSASLLSPAHLGAVPPFSRPYGSLAGLGSPPFGGLGSLTSPYSRDFAALRHLHGMASPHEWNRLQRTPPSFPQPPAALSKESTRDKEILDRDRDFRDKDRLKELQRHSPSVRGSDISGRRSLEAQHSRSSIDLMERARSRSPIRNGPVHDTSNRTTPLIRSSSTSSNDAKVKEERKDDIVVIDDRERFSHERQNGFKHDLHSKLDSGHAAMSRITDFMSQPNYHGQAGLTSSLMDRARFYPSYPGMDRAVPPGLWGPAVDIERHRDIQRDLERHRDSMLGRYSAIDRERLIEYERKTMSGLGAMRPMDLYGLGGYQPHSMVMHHRTTSPHLHNSSHGAGGAKTASPMGNLGGPPPLIPNSSHHVNHSTSSSHSSQHSQSPAITKTKSASPLVISQDEKSVSHTSNGFFPQSSSR